MWLRASLKFKLVASFLLVSVFVLIVGAVGYWTLCSAANDYTEVAEYSLPNIRTLGDMRGAALESFRYIILLTTTNPNEDHRKKMVQSLNALLEEYATLDKAYRDIPFAPGEEEIYAQVNQRWQILRGKIEEILPLSATKDPAERAKLEEVILGDLNDEMNSYVEEVGVLRTFDAKMSKTYVDEAQAAAHEGTLISFVVSLSGIVIALVIGFAFANTISRRLGAMSERLLAGARDVALASEQISGASTELSTAVEQQAASLQETSTSIEEISAMVKKNSENAQLSQSASDVSRGATESGRQAVDEMIHAVQEISRSNDEIGVRIQESNREFSEIVQVISEIGNKTRVINDIVFQTKLLSFNASVEAARAGEHGKGFSVVAEEVGSLAQMSGNAAKEISELLSQSIQRVEDIVKRSQSDLERLMSTGKVKVAAGQSVAERCGQILDEVVSHVGEMNRMAAEIASASNEQSQGVQEIGNAMQQLDQVTHQNASAAHETAAASGALSSQAEALHGLVTELTTFVRGQGAHEMKSTVHERPAPKAKVLKFALKKQAQPAPLQPTEKPALKMASGGEVAAAPLDSDPRFKDI